MASIWKTQAYEAENSCIRRTWSQIFIAVHRETVANPKTWWLGLFCKVVWCAICITQCVIGALFLFIYAPPFMLASPSSISLSLFLPPQFDSFFSFWFYCLLKLPFVSIVWEHSFTVSIVLCPSSSSSLLFFLFLLFLHHSFLSKEFVFSTCVKGRLQAAFPSTSLCSQKSPWLSTLLGVKNLWKETKIIVLVLFLSFYISLLKTKSPQELKCYINGLYHEN